MKIGINAGHGANMKYHNKGIEFYQKGEKEYYDEFSHNLLLCYAIYRLIECDYPWHSVELVNTSHINKKLHEINNERYDVFISIHSDYFTNENVHGNSIRVQNGDLESYGFAQKMIDNGFPVRNKNKPVYQDLGVLRSDPSDIKILIENGFFSNKVEREAMLRFSYYEDRAKMIIESFLF